MNRLLRAAAVLCALAATIFPSAFAQVPTSELIVIKVKVDAVRGPQTIFDVFRECANDATCQAALSAIDAYFGGAVLTTISQFALEVGEDIEGEDTTYRIQLPNGYYYCRTHIDVISVAPATGDRASFMDVTSDVNGLTVKTWTPEEGLGNGESWMEADFTVVASREDVTGALRNQGVCRSADRYLRYQCRGATGVNNGAPACGPTVDD